MSPENASVIIVDDDKDKISTLTIFLKREGHQIKAVVFSKEKGQNLIKRLSETDEKIDVALIDGNLSEYSYDGQDGEHLAEQVRNQLPGVKVISISGLPQDWSDRPNLTFRDGSAAISKAVTEA